ncbi:MAG: polymer-forming cytoskeletal protein [Deltaproteobacteria bacterium]|nr:MAG: polymer-forming cytoskeletal protein [Deltaproteobacteria bacterium]
MVDQRFDETVNTTVGSTIIVRGNLEGDEDLTVQGRVEGKLSLAKDLFIEPSGVVKADINVQNVYISGILVGNIVAMEKVEIASDGRMVGDINSPRVLIHDGASFRGRIEMGDMAAGPRPSVERPSPRATLPPRPVVRPTPVPSTPAPRAEERPAPRAEGTKPPEKKEVKPILPTRPKAKVEAEGKKTIVVGKKGRGKKR